MKTIFKFIIAVPILCTFFISIIFIGAGVYETVLGVYGVLNGQIGTETRPGVMLFHALDIFLLAFLFLIFSIGFAQLFIPKPSRIMTLIDTITPDWLKVENFTQLKLILWDTVLTTLVVFFLSIVVRDEGEYNWQTAIIPGSILLISLSKYLIKRAN
jgi:uncharacterized membrane protein YqhA